MKITLAYNYHLYAACTYLKLCWFGWKQPFAVGVPVWPQESLCPVSVAGMLYSHPFVPAEHLYFLHKGIQILTTVLAKQHNPVTVQWYGGPEGY